MELYTRVLKLDIIYPHLIGQRATLSAPPIGEMEKHLSIYMSEFSAQSFPRKNKLTKTDAFCPISCPVIRLVPPYRMFPQSILFPYFLL